MAFPIIGYKSMLFLSTTTITDPGSAPGHPITKLADRKAHTTWISNTTTTPISIVIDAGAGGADVNYFGLVNHNFGSDLLRVIIFQRDDPLDPWTAIFGAQAEPPSDDAFMQLFNSVGSHRYWLVSIDAILGSPAVEPPKIGELHLGFRTEMPEYLDASSDPHLSGREVKGSRAPGGHFLPADTRRTNRGTLSFGAAGVERPHSAFQAFLDSARLRYPFFFVVDPDDSEFSAARYLRLSDGSDTARLAVAGRWNRLSVNLDVEEAWSEAP